MFVTELRKWTKTCSVTLADETAYKLDFFLIIFAPAIVFLFINYNLWTAVYQYNGLANLEGYSLAKMLEYQAWVFIVSLLALGHRSWNLSEDIRLGRITAFLLYPFEFWKFHMAAFLSFQVVTVFVGLVSLVVLLGVGLISSFSLAHFLTGALFCIGVALLWFILEFACGLGAFWLEETWIFRLVFELSATLLSGAIIPLEFFPAGLRAALVYTPFPLITSVPVQIMLGTYQGDLTHDSAALLAWIIGFSLFASVLWKRGIRHYVAAGI